MNRHVKREIHRNQILIKLYECASGMSDRELYDFVLDQAVDLTDSHIGFLHLVSDDQKSIVLTTWNQAARTHCTAAYDAHYPLDQAGNWVDCIRQRRPVVYNDFARSPNQKGLPEGHTPLKRFLSVPVLEEDKVRIIFGVGNKPNPYTEADTYQIQLVANELHKIIKQRKADERLRLSEEKFATMFRTSPVMLMVNDFSDGRIVDVNNAFLRCLGYERDEIINKRMPDIGFWANLGDRARFRATLTKFNRISNMEFDFRCRSGEIRQGAISSELLQFGEDTLALSVLMDNTERKKMEQALVRSEIRYRFLFEQNPAPMLIYDCESLRLLAVNQAFEIYYGYSGEEALSLSLPDLFPENERKTVPELVELLSSRLSLGEWRHRKKDGAITSIVVRSHSIDFDGQTANVMVVTDVTERKKAEDTLRLSRDRLAQAEHMVKMGNWELDLRSNHLAWSDEIYRIFEIDKTLFGASYETFLALIHPEDRMAVDEAFRSSLREKAPYEITHRLLFPEGRIKYVHERCQTTYGDDGTPLLSMGTVQDVTERVMVEETIRTLNQELEQRVQERTAQLEAANRELEAFAYSVSHDLRAPLRAIDGFTKILMEDYAPQLDTEANRICSIICKNTVNMGQLIDDLLTFSRLGRTKMSPSRIDMATMANSIFFELTTEKDRERVDFSVGPIPGTHGDPSLLRQVWANLISNALKFSSKMPRSVIAIDGDQDGGLCHYSIRDNGVGFDPQYTHKLFGVFQRLHSIREFEGTGVGLAIVQRIVHRHGGRVWAESEVGKGAVFHFTM